MSRPRRGLRKAPQARSEYSSVKNGIHNLLCEVNVYDGLFPAPIGIVIKPSDDIEEEDVEIMEYKIIGSYSWVDANVDEPTILVPGSPPRWENRELPLTVNHVDRGPRIVDQNAFRTWAGGIKPLLPVVAAVGLTQQLAREPPFDWSSVDILVDRSSLRKIVRWADGRLAFGNKVRKADKLFRLDLRLLGKKTIFIDRFPMVYAESTSYQTYREGFRTSFLARAPGCERAVDNNQIICYRMNGIKMVVRFGVDAYQEASSADQVQEITTSHQEATSLGSMQTIKTRGLNIQQAGKLVPHENLLELTTRWRQNPFEMDWCEVYCQLFLAQIPKHIIAYQDNGQFERVEERSIDSHSDLEGAEVTAQKQLKRLVRAIKRIIELVMKEGKHAELSLVCVNGEMRLFIVREQGSCLPSDMLSELFD